MKNIFLIFLKGLKSRNVGSISINFDDFDFSSLSNNNFAYCDPLYMILTETYNDGKLGFTE